MKQKFADYTTFYTQARLDGETKEQETAVDFYTSARMAVGVQQQEARSQNPGLARRLLHFYCRLACEDVWYRQHKPYYKVWRDVIPLLMNVEVAIPFEYLKLPFEAFAIRLPEDQDVLVTTDGVRLKSLLVCNWGYDDTDKLFDVVADFGGENYGNMHMTIDPTGTIEDVLKNVLAPANDNWKLLRGPCLRLAVSICFLATGEDRLVKPDVLSKDLAQYIEAIRKGNEREAQQLVARSHKKGRLGWHVGQYERCRPWFSSGRSSGVGEDVESEEGSEHTRQPLTHQHQRRAHFRLLSNGKVVFIKQVTVRPDLPPPERAPAYQIR